MRWFAQIGVLRPSGFNGPERIGWQDMSAWSQLTGTELLPEEVEMMVAMDGAYVDQVRKEQAETQKAAERKK